MDASMRAYCTPKQLTYLDHWLANGMKNVDTAKHFGISPTTIRDAWRAIERKAAKAGWAPAHDMTKKAAPGFSVKGTSTLYDELGQSKIQWVKTDRDKEEMANKFEEAILAIIEPCRGVATPVPDPPPTNNKLITVYPIPEPHIGLYTWDEEVGQNYDTDLAVNAMIESFKYLVNASPASETCLVLNLADMMHMDNESGKTERSGHDLDVDTRWGRVIRKAVHGLREIINLALANHEKVYYKSGKGNHDDKASIFFAMMLEAYFENEPRLIVDVPNTTFAYHRFGKNLFGVHHGDLKGIKGLPLLMATDRPADWGMTTFRTFFVGHKHHKEVIEHPGCTVEMMRTICPEDSHAHRQGYRHIRSSEAITYDFNKGEISRVIKNIT